TSQVYRHAELFGYLTGVGVELATPFTQLDSTTNLSKITSKPIAMADINACIIKAINQHRQSDSVYFSSRDKLASWDFCLLLRIVSCTVVDSVASPPDLRMCGAHLAGHIELFTALESAYLSKSFADLVHHPSVIALVTTAKEAEDDTYMEPSGPRAKSSSNGSLQTAFEEPYLGVAHTRFIAALEHYSSYGDNKKPYMKSISVIQSSGMG
ncbi:unnamed protein product, partial [Rhizoctonia solani]